jgi:hypothetical protein
MFKNKINSNRDSSFMRYPYFILFAVQFLSSCENKVSEIQMPNKQDSTDTISFSKTIRPIMETYCYGDQNQKCHVSGSNQGAPGDFSNYIGVKSKIDKGVFESRVINPSGGMPPNYSNTPQKLTQSDLDDLKKWISQGALNN